MGKDGMIERDMEDLMATYPTDFFPHHTFVLVERQSSFAGVGRFDLLFKDDHDSTILMELKARTLKYEDATQVARYRDELKRNGHKNIVMWLVAPQIPTSVREFLDDKGIEYSEFHFGQFRRVAERHSFIIKSEAESSSQSGPSKVPENKNQSRQPRGLCSSQQGISCTPCMFGS